MAVRIYVDNLPTSVTSEALSELFSKVGDVESISIVAGRDGRDETHAFVSMTCPKRSREAIRSLNGSTFLGRRLTVTEAGPPARQSHGFSNRTTPRERRSRR